MQIVKTLIVDDEPRAHSILEHYIARIPELQVAGNAFNAIDAHAWLKKNPVDLIFLDITMPELDGFTFLGMLDKPPFIIFTTAHSEFALESYEYNAVDYLKKPIPYERFARAIQKLMMLLDKQFTAESIKGHIDLKIDGLIRAVPLNQILFIQSMGNYVKIFFPDKPLVTQITTAELEDILIKWRFVRIHKSYIVNRSKIERVGDDELLVGDTWLPIGKTFKKYVKAVVGFDRHRLP
jgi:two-component system, LytTR family, response regulator